MWCLSRDVHVKSALLLPLVMRMTLTERSLSCCSMTTRMMKMNWSSHYEDPVLRRVSFRLGDRVITLSRNSRSLLPLKVCQKTTWLTMIDGNCQLNLSNETTAHCVVCKNQNFILIVCRFWALIISAIGCFLKLVRSCFQWWQVPIDWHYCKDSFIKILSKIC